MFGLLDDDEPPPRFSFSALLALVASAGAAAWESITLWSIASTSLHYLFIAILLGAITIAPVQAFAVTLCALAMYFRQHRWAYIGFGLMGIPYAALVVYLVVAQITG